MNLASLGYRQSLWQACRGTIKSKQKRDIISRGLRLVLKYHYTLCGWRTSSDIPLSGIATTPHSSNDTDILIEIATGNSPIANLKEWVDTADCLLIRARDVAEYEVKYGRQIRVWPSSGATPKDIELFLFGVAWGALCHQRGILPLHASAILAKGRIAAFAGPSGIGKSTTAALMGSLGYKVLTDDILPVSLNRHSVPGAWPFLRRLKLEKDSVTSLSLVPSELVSEKLDDNRYFIWPKNVAGDKWFKLDRIYVLETDSSISDVSIDQITGADAVRALVDQTYHFGTITHSGRLGDHLSLCTLLASHIAVYRLRRSPTLGISEELKASIHEHLEADPVPTSVVPVNSPSPLDT
jgi:hypothetical protein